MKFSFSSAAAAIISFFIALAFSGPLAPATSLVVEEQIRTMLSRREWCKVRKIPTRRSYKIPYFCLQCHQSYKHMKQGDVICNTDRLGHTNWASSRYTRRNYNWIFKHGGEWRAKAGETGRVRCARSSAIYVLNTVHHHPFFQDFLSPTSHPGHARERDANEKGMGMNRLPTTSWFRMLILQL